MVGRMSAHGFPNTKGTPAEEVITSFTAVPTTSSPPISNAVAPGDLIAELDTGAAGFVVKDASSVIEVHYSVRLSHDTAGATAVTHLQEDSSDVVSGTGAHTFHAGAAAGTVSRTVRFSPTGAGARRIRITVHVTAGTVTANGISRSMIVKEIRQS